MPTINFMGTNLYIQTKPTFRGSKAPVLKKVPYTADNPTMKQRKARAWLARTANGKRGTFGTVSNTGHGKAGPQIAREIFNAKPGKGVHGGYKTMREYAISRRVPDSRIRDLEAEAAITVPT
jgi:hypothetical protein